MLICTALEQIQITPGMHAGHCGMRILATLSQGLDVSVNIANAYVHEASNTMRTLLVQSASVR